MYWSAHQCSQSANGHCRVAADYVTEDSYRLGQWVRVQRERQAKLLPDRRRRLEELPGWSWDVLSDQWQENFSRLKEFSEREGYCRVPREYKTEDGYPLGQWVRIQRKTRRQMDPDRRRRLEALPRWTWDAFADKWEEGFSRLKEFSEREGHCRVASDYRTEEGYRLGLWVSDQGERQAQMPSERRRRLEQLKGWSWDLLPDQWWDDGFICLKEFSEREGHCRVPKRYVTKDGYLLGQWVGVQRRRRHKMDADRRQRLEALPGWSWDPRTDQWEYAFSRLKEFSEREGHYRVPDRYETEDRFRLGTWVTTWRARKDEMSPDRRRRLEALPGWLWAAIAKWEDGFCRLKNFSQREGHCRVPNAYMTKDGYQLGSWVSNQRARFGKMHPKRKRRLEELPEWVWKERD